MVRTNPIWIESEASTQDEFSNYVWTCDMCGNSYLASDKCWTCPGRGLGGKGIAGAKGEMSDQGKKGLGKQWQIKGQTKGNVGQQRQADAGIKDGKPQKRKGKALANQQWQQQANAKGCRNGKGITNGSQGFGWQANGGMQAQAQGQHIPGVSLPQQKGCSIWNAHRCVQETRGASPGAAFFCFRAQYRFDRGPDCSTQ